MRIIVDMMLLVIGISLIPLSLACQANSRTGTTINEMKERNVSAEFYGKVVDQDGNAIAGVTIDVGYSYIVLDPRLIATEDISVTTDKNGQFAITGIIAMKISIRNIVKQGYERNYIERKTFEYHADKKLSYMPDINNPIIFKMRKKGEESFLLETGIEFTFQNDQNPVEQGYDLIHQINLAKNIGVHYKDSDTGVPTFNGMPLHCDIKTNAVFDDINRTWTVKLVTPDPGAGVILSNQLLYMAPKDGYQPLVVFDIPTGVKNEHEPRYYVYIKSRVPPIYSRIRIDGGSWVKEESKVEVADIVGQGFLNPYGERNMEKATGLPADISVELRNEARKAFRIGDRPTKPDLEKMIQKWEKSRPFSEKIRKWLGMNK